MEQGNYFIVGKQGGFIPDRGCQITGQIGNRNLGFAVDMIAIDAFIHPGAAAFVFARVQIQIKLTNHFTCGIINLVEAYRFVPDINLVICGFYIDTVEDFYDFKQSADDVVVAEVGL